MQTYAVDDVMDAAQLDALQERLDQLDLDPIKVKLMDPEEGKGWTLGKERGRVQFYHPLRPNNWTCPRFFPSAMSPVEFST